MFSKIAKFSIAALSVAALVACGDSSSSSSAEDNGSETSYDCSVKDGVKVVAPAKGDSFKMGDTITVVYGSDVEGSGYSFKFKTSEEDAGTDMLEESAGPEKPDGKTCYEQKVVLTKDVAEPAEEAIIRVVPYEKTSKGSNSGTFKVTK